MTSVLQQPVCRAKMTGRVRSCCPQGGWVNHWDERSEREKEEGGNSNQSSGKL